MRNLLVGVAGSALALAIDLGVMHWGSESILVRMGSAVFAFVVFFAASVVIPRREARPPVKSILSGIKSKGSVDVDAGKIESADATDILSGIEAKKNVKIEVDDIKS